MLGPAVNSVNQINLSTSSRAGWRDHNDLFDDRAADDDAVRIRHLEIQPDYFASFGGQGSLP